MELKKNDLEKIEGGITAWAIAGIISVGIFLIGMIDGFIRPLKCNN